MSAVPQIVGEALDANWNQVTWSKLNIAALKVLGASAMSGLFLFLQRRILIGMSRNIEYDLREDFYRRLVNQPLSFFHEHRTGDLMARATNDLSAVRQLAGPMIMYSLQTSFRSDVHSADHVCHELEADAAAVRDDAAGLADG